MRSGELTFKICFNVTTTFVLIFSLLVQQCEGMRMTDTNFTVDLFNIISGRSLVEHTINAQLNFPLNSFVRLIV